jgi:hypothetical protein
VASASRFSAAALTASLHSESSSRRPPMADLTAVTDRFVSVASSSRLPAIVEGLLQVAGGGLEVLIAEGLALDACKAPVALAASVLQSCLGQGVKPQDPKPRTPSCSNTTGKQHAHHG